MATLDQLDRGDDGLRLKTSGELFTGHLVDYYTGGETNRLKSRSVIRDGKLNGLSEGWYTDGQQQVAEMFVDGKSHGVRVKWHPNGRTNSITIYQDGIQPLIWKLWQPIFQQ